MARMNRRNQVDLSECLCYHVISRCTRKLHLFGGTDEERAERKGLLLRHLERVATATAVGVAGFSVMDNHLHLVLKVDTESARKWSTREVARRWLVLHPPRDGYRRRVATEGKHIDAVLDGLDAAGVEELREKLMSVSQFMKELKQEVSQEINRLDDTVGSVWAGRFKCVRVMDEAQLLTAMVYVDLNPFAARACETPEAGEHTSLAARLGEGAEPDSTSKNNAIKQKRKGGAAPRERRGWWMTVGGGQPGAKQPRRAVMPGTTLTFGRYLKLLDAVARLLRKGKKTLRSDASPILDRMTASPKSVAGTVKRWFEEGLPWDRPRRANAG